jgi:large repetitive protein
MKIQPGLTMTRIQFPRSSGSGPANSSFTAAAMLLFSLLLYGFMSGCGGGSGGSGGGNQVQTFTVVLSPTLPVIAVGGAEQFTGSTVDNSTGNPDTISGLTYAYTSSNTSVATIDPKSGLATAVGVGTTTIQVIATNSENNGVGQPITMLKVVNPLTTDLDPLPVAALTFSYTSPVLGSGGNAPLTWTLVNGTTLPAGLTLNSNGTISGTPTISGVSANFTVQVTDTETPPVAKQGTFSIAVIDPANPCNILTNSNPGILNGHYAFMLQGFQATTANGTPVAMAGSFLANGSGGITAGELNLNNASSQTHLTINGGNYAVNSSGQGCVQLKYTSGASNVFHFALSQVLNASNIATYGRMIEFDGYQGSQGGAATNIVSGVLLLQNPAEFSSVAARFAFGMDGFDMAGKHVALGGSFNFSNATDDITNFAEDLDDGGTISTVTGASGTLNSAPDFNGGAGVTLTLPGPTTVYMALYVVNANEMVLVSQNPLSATSPIYSGRAIVTGSSYNANSLSGNYIYRAAGVDYQSDGVTCAASGPCALTDVAVMSANAATGALGGTLYQLQAGATQTSTITETYSVGSSTGRVQLSSASGAKLPVFYLATPVTSGTDTTEPIDAFIVGSGPTMNSNSGDPTALFGLIEAQPSGPFSLTSPPAYIFATEDSGQITIGTIVGYGSFSSGTISVSRDISNTIGLTLNATGNSFSFTPNADGTVSGTASMTGATTTGTLVGATNSTAASPGKVLFVPNSAVTGVRLLEP